VIHEARGSLAALSPKATCALGAALCLLTAGCPTNPRANLKPQLAELQTTYTELERAWADLQGGLTRDRALLAELADPARWQRNPEAHRALLRQALLECFTSPFLTPSSDPSPASANNPSCDGQAIGALRGLQAQVSPEEASELSGQLDRVALLKHDLRRALPRQTQALAERYVAARVRAREIRLDVEVAGIENSSGGLFWARDAEDFAKLQQSVRGEIVRLEALLEHLDDTLLPMPQRLQHEVEQVTRALVTVGEPDEPPPRLRAKGAPP
jgi:hypothetical protein